MSIKIKNDFDGSNPTAEMPKISFSCGLDKKIVDCCRQSFFFILTIKRVCLNNLGEIIYIMFNYVLDFDVR